MLPIHPRRRLRRLTSPSESNVASFDVDHLIVRWVAFIGGAAVVIGNSERSIDDPKLWALAISGGCAALAVLLRPPGIPKPEKEVRG